MLTKKRIETDCGLFRIVAPILNENETWTDENAKPIISGDDFLIDFIPKNSKGVISGKKHFKTIEQAELYINLLFVNGFTKMDL